MKCHAILVTIITLTFSTLTVSASAAEPSLKQIMQGLRDNLIEITDGLLIDDFDRIELFSNGAEFADLDFDRIEQGANGIAQHPQIAPPQVKRVAKELGSEMPQFKQFDVQVHNLSLSIAAAAREKNSDVVWAEYQPLVSGCLGCHEAFKDRVSEVLARVP